MRIYIAILGILCLLFSCKNEEKSGAKTPSKEIWQEEALAFLSNEEHLLSFGVLEIDQLLTKSIYNSQLSESVLIPLDMIEDYSKLIYTKLPIYFAIRSNVEGSLTSPDAIVICKIKSKSLWQCPATRQKLTLNNEFAFNNMGLIYPVIHTIIND